ncbi:DUF883 family protein [Bdellovibrio sp. SKB1291214]|uniref:DUF883 family protein n=1 Tax=Bdellovibrio sp. SKB1291214 TaxID=1732569 RepID=UPI000B51687C|nr:DUF883 family protein [Bdellovibrio sp. SKB1291214]UYL07255.1 DUF883 family protein [Bdellovibrio sp. SKB1291214]
MAETSREFMNDIKSTGKQAADTGKQLYGEAKSELKSKVNEAKSELESTWGDRYETIKHKAQDAMDTSEDFIKDHPIATVLGACAVGFVAGLIARRRN